MNFKPRIILTSVLAVGAYFLYLVYFGSAAHEKTVVALDHPLSGLRQYDTSGYDAAKLYAETNPTSRLVIKDVYYDPASLDSELFFQESLQNGIDFFITSQPSSKLMASAHLFEKPDALLFNLAAATSELSNRDDFIVRLIGDSKLEQTTIAQFVNTLPGDRLLVLQDTSNPAYTDNAYRYFLDALKTTGRWKVVHEKVLLSQVNPTELAEQMQQPFDALYVLAGNFQPNVATFIQFFHKSHPTAPVLLTSWSNTDELYAIAGVAGKNIVIPSRLPRWQDQAKVSDYMERFQQRFGYRPVSVAYGIQQALEILDQAAKAGHVTPQDVRNYLISTQNIKTSLGNVSFNDFGDPH